MSSPCIGLCTIEPRSGFCSGCGRSLDEIAAWGTMLEVERRAVIARLPARVTADAGEQRIADLRSS